MTELFCVSRRGIHFDACRRRLMAAAGLLLTTVGAVLPGRARPLAARKRGPARSDVRDHGARGDGRKDDTAAFQSAIDALPAEGGTVIVPRGTYLIDPTKDLRLRSRTHLKMSSSATLKARPNSAERAYVLNAYRVSDVEISGGRIVGERDEHLGTKGEWGHGIMVRGSNRVTVRDMHISRCWGDGMSIGQATIGGGRYIPSDDVVVSRIVSTGNRRQGLSIGASRNVKVYDSEFSYTKGTAPECGIDIEPDVKGLTTASNVLIENCRLRHNNQNGILVYRRVTGVTISRSTIEFNRGYGIYTVSPVGGCIDGNRIQHNYWGGVTLRAATKGYKVSGNTFRNNNTRLHGIRLDHKPLASIVGVVMGNKGTAAHLRYTPDCRDIRVTTNCYSN